MVLKKSLMIASAVATIGVGGLAASTHSASAETNGTTLIDKIAQKFNLNKDDVQKVFDENRSEKEAAHQTKIEEKLTQAVKDGKLTEDQKTKILAKLEELKNNRPDKEDMQNKTEAEHRSLMEQRRSELQKWAQDNNIPEEYLRFAGPGGHGKIKHVRGNETPDEAPGAPVLSQ